MQNAPPTKANGTKNIMPLAKRKQAINADNETSNKSDAKNFSTLHAALNIKPTPLENNHAKRIVTIISITSNHILQLTVGIKND